ncbi:MAG: hypothetical protein RIE77_10375 [Phycisphaerales bacterium]
MGYWVRYTDDREERLASGYLRTAGRARKAGVPRDAAKRALKKVNAQGMAMGLLFGTTIVVVRALANAWSGPGGFQGGYLVAGVVVVLVALALHPFVVPRAIRAHKRGFLDEGYCPACGYSIAGLELEEDNCRVCPECGSAWKLEVDATPPSS